MGSLRTFLAITVVLSHSYGYIFVGGRLAVQLFYIISGFLISYILIETKSYKSVKGFYSNRVLRLFPVYYFISFLTLLFLFYQSTYLDRIDFFETFTALNLTGKLYLIFSNIFILGQDLAFFMGGEDGNLILMSQYASSETVIYKGLISQVTWTISLEICFYLIAPFVLINMRLMLILLFLSIALRVILIYQGIGLSGGFTYRFFPLELSLFLLGALSHQILKPYFERKFLNNMNSVSVLLTGFFIAYCAAFSFLPGIIPNTLIVVSLAIILLPFLFHFQNIYSFDSWIGKFSYPIYVSQWPILIMAQDYFPEYSIKKVFVILIGTLILAYVAEHLVSSPIEKIRQRNKSKLKL